MLRAGFSLLTLLPNNSTKVGPISTSAREEYGAPALPLPGLSGKGNNVTGKSAIGDLTPSLLGNQFNSRDWPL